MAGIFNGVTGHRFDDFWTARAEFRKIQTRHHAEPEIRSGPVFGKEAEHLLKTDLVLAEARARRALANCPRDTEAQYLLGATLTRQARYREACEILEPLTRTRPQLGGAWRSLGFARKKLGDPGGAIDAFLNVVDLGPVDRAAWRSLGDLLNFRGARELEGSDPRLADAEAAILEERYEDAESLLRVLLDAEPSNIRALKLLADALIGNNRWNDAKPLLERCLSVAPGFEAARFRYASMLTAHNEYRRALPEIGRLLEADSANPVYRHLKAIATGGTLQFEAAIDLYKALLASSPDRPGLWYQYLRMVREARPRDAVTVCEEMRRRFPFYVEVYYILATIKSFRFNELWLERVRGALQSEDLWADMRVQLHFVLGKALEDLKTYPESFAHYKKSNDLLCESAHVDIEERSNFKWRSKAVFTRGFFCARPDVGCQESGPIFIVGMPRAGSTLVEQILSSHTAIEGIEELADLSEIVRKELEPKSDSAGPPYPSNVKGLELDRLRALGEEYLSRTRLRRRTSRPFFTDKAPINYLHVGIIHLILPNARIIDARRHPLDCCFSCYKHYFSAGQNLTWNLRTVGRSYAEYVELMAHYDEVLPGCVHRVIYERMIENPEKEIRRLLDYVGVPFEEQCLKFHETKRFVRTISAEQVRMPIYKTGVAHWRNYEEWLGPLKEELGYLLDVYPEVPRFFPRIRMKSSRFTQGDIHNSRLVMGLRQIPFENAG